MSIVWLLWTNMWFVHLFSTQAPLIASALPQWEPTMQSHLHYTSSWVSLRAWQDDFLSALPEIISVSWRKWTKKNMRWLEEVFWVFRCGSNRVGCIYRRFPANWRVLGSPQRHLPQILRVVAWLRLLRRRAVRQREEEMAGPRQIQSVRYEGRCLGKCIAAPRAKPTCTLFTLFIRVTQNLVASRLFFFL